MDWFWWLLVIFVVILWVVALFDIFRQWGSRSGGKTAAWIIAILVFPVFGAIAYFIVNNAGGGAGGEGAPREPLERL
jgi:Phospholipase_D-nuclease N-terminal